MLVAVIYAVHPGEKLMAENNPYFLSIEDIPASNWNTLAAKKIYFGHQSVGNNILQGVKEVMQEHGQIKLHISETTPSEITSANSFFTHSHLGRNGEPKSKIDDFANLFEKNDVDVDLASFKFCYVDFDGTTDVNQVFEYYKKTMSRLQHNHPRTTFMHVTVPLVTSHQGVKQGVKEWVKGLLGRPTVASINSKRNQFNDLLRKEFEGKELIFDLAEIEATYPDGRRASYTYEGKTYHSMVQTYSDDGGHLNEMGRRIVAEQFLVFLASALPAVSQTHEQAHKGQEKTL